MKRFHIALCVANLDASITDYTARLGAAPETVLGDRLAVWRTPQLNFTIERRPEQAGQLLHVGFEDDAARQRTREEDVNGIRWENFSVVNQMLAAVTPRDQQAPREPEDALIRN